MNADAKLTPSSLELVIPNKSEHPYNYVTGNNLLLYEGEATVSRNKTAKEKEKEPDGEKIQLQCKLKITQKLSPPRLDWECIADGISEIGFEEVDVASDYFFKGRVYSKSLNRIAGTVVEPGIEKGGDHDLSKVVFYLPGWLYKLRFVLSCGDFKISLSENPSFDPDPAEMRSRDDIRFDGLGTIKRTDGAKFKKKAVQQVIDVLESFLSFAFNAWCPPMLIVGSSDDCATSWECWRDSRVSMRHGSRGWFDEIQDTDQLEQAFPGFFKLWEKDEWRTHLKLVLGWLIEASNSSPTSAAAVAVSQIPIELLASVVVCDEYKLLTSEDFEKINTAGRFRLMTSYLRIPNEVPKELHSLTKLNEAAEATNSIVDAPSLLVKIRNSIIHPKSTVEELCKKCEVDLEDAQWEAARLYWWYINLVLLNMMNYSGKYTKRLTSLSRADEFACVPWSETDQGSSDAS